MSRFERKDGTGHVRHFPICRTTAEKWIEYRGAVSSGRRWIWGQPLAYSRS